MSEQDVLKAIANLADRVSKYRERLLAVERDIDKHENDSDMHRCESYECENR